MEEKNKIMRSMLLDSGNKFILLSSSIFSAETFLKKLSLFSKAEKTNKQKFQKMTFLTYSIKGFSPSNFYITKKLDNLLDLFEKIHLNKMYLKQFSLVFFSNNYNLDDFSYLFKELIFIEKPNDKITFNSNKKIIILDFEEISESHINIFFPKKLRIFNILKKKLKKKSEDLTKKSIIMQLNSNGNEKELLLENSVKINSLINISKEVKHFIKMKQQTTYHEVTKYILNLLREKLNNGNVITYKNVQRRVYDAINVMCSLKIIEKENTTLTYYKFNQNKLKEEIENKRNILISKYIELQCYNNLIEKNKNNFFRSLTTDKIELPFNLLISDSSNDEISIKTNKEKNKLIASFKNGKFNTFSQISKELIYNENINFNNYNNNYNNNNEILVQCENYIENKKLYDNYFLDLKHKKEKKEELTKTRNHLFETDFSNYLNNNNITLNSVKLKNDDNDIYINDNNLPIYNISDKNTIFL